MRRIRLLNPQKNQLTGTLLSVTSNLVNIGNIMNELPSSESNPTFAVTSCSGPFRIIPLYPNFAAESTTHNESPTSPRRAVAWRSPGPCRAEAGSEGEGLPSMAQSERRDSMKSILSSCRKTTLWKSSGQLGVIRTNSGQKKKNPDGQNRTTELPRRFYLNYPNLL